MAKAFYKSAKPENFQKKKSLMCSYRIQMMARKFEINSFNAIKVIKLHNELIFLEDLTAKGMKSTLYFYHHTFTSSPP